MHQLRTHIHKHTSIMSLCMLPPIYLSIKIMQRNVHKIIRVRIQIFSCKVKFGSSQSKKMKCGHFQLPSPTSVPKEVSSVKKKKKKNLTGTEVCV